jgi:hypothetical protein
MALYLPENRTLVGNELIRGKCSRLFYCNISDEEKGFILLKPVVYGINLLSSLLTKRPNKLEH